jgi:uncharacterized protein (DUF608 family)
VSSGIPLGGIGCGTVEIRGDGGSMNGISLIMVAGL